MLRAFAAALLLAGCHADVKPTPTVDPDRDSGPDRQRSGAREMPVNRPVTDDVSYAKGDATDWKVVQLAGAPGLLEVRLAWDNANADLNVDVFDAYGQQVASSPGLSPGAVEKKVLVDAKPGTWFIRVSAPRAEDASVYTLGASWQGAAPSAISSTEPTPTPTPPPPNPDQPATDAPPATDTPQSDEDGVEGRVVTSYREGGDLVLHIDKGAAAGVKVGTTGFVLDGPSGEGHLDGGAFTITKVVDASRSVARCALKSIGRNNRVVLIVR